jgi:uncharacterized membrane protein
MPWVIPYMAHTYPLEPKTHTVHEYMCKINVSVDNIMNESPEVKATLTVRVHMQENLHNNLPKLQWEAGV